MGLRKGFHLCMMGLGKVLMLLEIVLLREKTTDDVGERENALHKGRRGQPKQTHVVYA